MRRRFSHGKTPWRLADGVLWRSRPATDATGNVFVRLKPPSQKRKIARREDSMPLKLRKSVKDLLAEANAEVETVSAEDALKLKDDENVVFVDIRDIRELNRDGRIPGAFHAPRGMLEFWVDPDSPYYKEVFGSGKKFLFF
jgi:hypothetical protein